MLRLLAHRARAQWPLLATLVTVVTLGASLLGACALLITRTAERALEVAASRAAPADIDVTAYVGTVRGPDARSVADDTRALVTSSLAPFAATTSTWASSVMRTLPGDPDGSAQAVSYLSGVDDLPERAQLTAGRWPSARAPGAATPGSSAPGASGPGASEPGASEPGASGSGASASETSESGWVLEAIAFEPTARLLGLTVGSRVRLGPELGREPAPAIDVTVVGIARALPGAGWDRDPFAGAGYDPAYRDGRFGEPVHAYGPFLVDLADLFAGGSTIDRLEITARPDLSAPNRGGLDAAAGAVRGADRQLARILGDRVQIERVASELPSTLRTARAQQQVAAATVLTIAVLGIVLTAVALALAGRLTAGVRASETVLLSALGVGRGQLIALAGIEAGVLSLLAVGLAVPISSVLHAGLTHLPPLDAAGLAADPGVTGVQLLGVAGGALALSAVLVVSAVIDPATLAAPTGPGVPAGAAPGSRSSARGGVSGSVGSSARSGSSRPVGSSARAGSSVGLRGGRLARSGVDLLLVAAAAVGWWQLNAQPADATARADAVRVLAPALLLTAGAALVLRLVPPALRTGERLVGRARGLALPLAVFDVARRPQAVAAGLLIGLACAAGTFGIAFDATWARSQHDQADLAVGTDLAVTLDTTPVPGQGLAVGVATGGEVSPAADRGVAVGQWLGTAGEAPRLVAIDTRRAGALLRGRLDGGHGWSAIGSALGPSTPVVGVAIPPGAALVITGTATGPFPIRVTPRFVLQDATGLRIPCAGPSILLDGGVHPLPACAAADGLRLVAVSLPVAVDLSALDSGDVTGIGDGDGGRSRVAVTLTVPGAGASTAEPPGSPWTATSAGAVPGQLLDPAVAVAPTTAAPDTAASTTAAPTTAAPDSAASTAASGTQLTMTATVQLIGAWDAARDLVATAFPDPGPVPVAVSSRFAGVLGAQPGTRLTLTVGTTPVPIVVTEILPTVPSAPGAAAVLADLDTLSRALVVNGNLDFPVDAWWVGHPTRADAAARAAELRLGTVTTRDGETARLTSGPVRAALPAALRLLVPAAALLLLAGIVLHVTCDLRLRALEVARLRGLGMYRREIRWVLLGQHAGVLVPLFAAGAVVGGLATVLVAPLLVRSDSGAAAVPAPVPSWPWAAEGAFLVALLAGCLLAVTAVVTVQARRADAANLRVAS